MRCPNCINQLDKRKGDAESVWHCSRCEGTFFIIVTTKPNDFQLTEQEILTFGKLIREKRLAAGITQKQFADAIGRDKSFISHLESDRRRWMLDDLMVFAEMLGIPLSQLFAEAELSAG